MFVKEVDDLFDSFSDFMWYLTAGRFCSVDLSIPVNTWNTGKMLPTR
jgi:hypothetical protein